MHLAHALQKHVDMVGVKKLYRLLCFRLRLRHLDRGLVGFAGCCKPARHGQADVTLPALRRRGPGLSVNVRVLPPVSPKAVSTRALARTVGAVDTKALRRLEARGSESCQVLSEGSGRVLWHWLASPPTCSGTPPGVIVLASRFRRPAAARSSTRNP